MSAILAVVFLGACGSGTGDQSQKDAAIGADTAASPFDGKASTDVPLASDGSTIDAALLAGCPVAPTTRPSSTPPWNTLADFRSAAAWYATGPAAYVAENVLYYQTSHGGWPKNIDLSYRYGVDATGSARDERAIFDNEATTTQIRYLAHMLGAFPGCQRYRTAFDRGLQFVFDAQYPSNGGWPQVFPIEETKYSRHITYNDSAMTRVLGLLRDIAYGSPEFAFLPAETVTRATTALGRGVDCILATQIVAGGAKTGWCQQHDAVTLLPAPARAYELESESGSEGPGVLAFLMSLDLNRSDLPKAAIIDAIEAAVLFYDQVKITGLAFMSGATDAGPSDTWVVPNAVSGPIWARFYELTPPFAPFFVGRSGVKVATLAEVEYERRAGYSYYVTNARTVLGATYTAWAAKWTPGRHVQTQGRLDGGGIDGGGIDGGNIDASSLD